MQTLRKLAADYILNHQDDFLPFLTDAKTGQLYTPGKQANKLQEYSAMSYYRHKAHKIDGSLKPREKFSKRLT